MTAPRTVPLLDISATADTTALSFAYPRLREHNEKPRCSSGATEAFIRYNNTAVNGTITKISRVRYTHCHPQYIIAFRICQALFADFHSIYIIYIYCVSISTHFILKKIGSLSRAGRVYSGEALRASIGIGIRGEAHAEPRTPSRQRTPAKTSRFSCAPFTKPLTKRAVMTR